MTDVVVSEQYSVSGNQYAVDGQSSIQNRQSEILRLAASAERGSEHPLGEAIVAAAREHGLSLSDPSDFESIAGHGIAAAVDGHDLLVGNSRLMERQSVALNGLGPKAEAMQNEAKTAMWLAVDGQASALIGVADTIKDGSKEGIAALKAMGLQVVMMTGDNEATAQSIAAEVGVDRIFAEVLPHEKADYIRTFPKGAYRQSGTWEPRSIFKACARNKFPANSSSHL